MLQSSKSIHTNIDLIFHKGMKAIYGEYTAKYLGTGHLCLFMSVCMCVSVCVHMYTFYQRVY